MRNREEEEEEPRWVATTALAGTAQEHTLSFSNKMDLNLLLIEYKQELVRKMTELMNASRTGIKWWLLTHVDALREVPGEDGQVEIEHELKHLRSGEQTLHIDESSVEGQVEKAILEVLANSEVLNVEGSGWVLGEIYKIIIRTGQHHPIVGAGSYMPLPPELADMKSLINIKNKDQDCFRLSVIAGMGIVPRRGRNVNRPQPYAAHVHRLNTDGIDYAPMRLGDVAKFEILNPDISLCILGVAKDEPANESKSSNPTLAAAAARALKAGRPLHDLGIDDDDDDDGDEDDVGDGEDEDDDDGEGGRGGNGGGRDFFDQAAQEGSQRKKKKKKSTKKKQKKGKEKKKEKKKKEKMKMPDIIVRYCTPEKKQNHVTLLLLEDRETGRSHYVLVKNFNAFLRGVRKSTNNERYCCYCLGAVYKGAGKLAEHEEACRKFGFQSIDYMEKAGPMSFDKFKWKNMQRTSYSVYYDFESVLIPLQDDAANGGPKTRRTQEHRAVAYCIVACNWKGELVEKITRTQERVDEDMARLFLEDLVELEERLWDQRPDYPIHMSEEQKARFDAATNCELCHKFFDECEEADRKTADHDHLEPMHSLRHICCFSCNGSMKRETFLPIFAHAGNRYDLHLIFRGLINNDLFSKSRITILPRTTDSYRSATIYLENGRKLLFLDSYQFVASSLDELSKSLRDDDLQILKEVFPDDEKRRLLTVKGIYPYELAEDFQQMLDTREYPPREAFHSSLSGSLPSEEEYQRGRKIWDVMECDSLMTYCRIYLETDTILLACFMNKFRNMIFKKYTLEINHFVSASSLSMCAMLKFTKCKVERCTDPTMNVLLTQAARGGYSSTHHRYAEANIPGTSSYRPSEPESHILMFDINAVSFFFLFFFLHVAMFEVRLNIFTPVCLILQMYSMCMEKSLPLGKFEWVSGEELEQVDWSKLSHDDDKMYFAYVDLEYPRTLHESHNEFPCCVERVKVPEDWYSPIQREMMKRCNLKGAQLHTEKLIAHLGPRKNYLLHGMALANYLKLGLKVTRFIKGIRFTQAPFLKEYIQDIMKERQKAEHKFEQAVWKIFSNSIYGQLLRNPRKDRTIELCRTAKRFVKLMAKPTSKGFTIFGEDLVAVERLPTVVRLNNLPAAGVTVLDFSKCLMMDLYWRMKNHFGERQTLLMSDTDSLCVHLKTPNLVEDLRPILDILDTSGLPEDHPLYDPQYARVQGRLKIEYGRFNILRFAGIRSKVYALDLETAEGGEKAVYKCKGIQKSALAQSVRFEDYKRCIFDNVTKFVEVAGIRTDGKHSLYTIKQNKSGLSNFDNKRYILEDGISTNAFCFNPLPPSPPPPSFSPPPAREEEPLWEDMSDDVLAHAERLLMEMSNEKEAVEEEGFWQEMDVDVLAHVEQIIDRYAQE
ncbi:uncharacterized protein LOC117639345 isoform X2 [Thrips palmi]|uniref:DNA-directed DNA polymerase n=1 Tax=Thrips palmi TaxID=161013 RepID=A0A6P8Y404_THRPL|nr:uncharacterized protein LOC117639345 isoform X2 [Thrips palmi]